MLQKVVKWEDGIAFLALMTQQHLSPSGGLGTAPIARLWALGMSEKDTVGKEQAVPQPPAPLPPPAKLSLIPDFCCLVTY